MQALYYIIKSFNVKVGAGVRACIEGNTDNTHE